MLAGLSPRAPKSDGRATGTDVGSVSEFIGGGEAYGVGKSDRDVAFQS